MTDPLFDQRSRTDASPGRHSEDWFTFLDRVDDVFFARVRTVLNTWHAELPAPSAERLRTRFRSGRQEQVESAYWELFLHAALSRSRLELELDIKPGSATTEIDFFSVSPDLGDSTYIEATIVGDPSVVRARRRLLEGALDQVNRGIPPGFFISVQIDQDGARPPSGRRLREAILPWLEDQDRESVARDVEGNPASYRLPERVFHVDDWRFRIRALPMTAEGAASADDGTPLIGIGPIETAVGGSRAMIMNALERKRPSRYGELEHPYVVALLDLHRFASVDELVSALFGEEALTLTLRGDQIVDQQQVRRANGFWRKDRNTSVAGVLYARRLQPWSLTSAEIQLIPNPWATQPMRLDFPWTRTWRVRADGDLRPDDPTMTLTRLFDLPPAWPGPEAPFERRESVSLRSEAIT